MKDTSNFENIEDDLSDVVGGVDNVGSRFGYVTPLSDYCVDEQFGDTTWYKVVMDGQNKEE